MEDIVIPKAYSIVEINIGTAKRMRETMNIAVDLTVSADIVKTQTIPGN